MGLIDSHPDTYLPRDSSGALRIIDQQHHEIHAGVHYTCSTYESIGAGSTLSMMITTPAAASGVAHMTGAMLTDGAGVWTWNEAPNATGGSALVEYNNDRTSTNAATVVCTKDPTFTSTGTVLIQSHIGTYAPSVNVGGQFSNRQEWILKASTKYLIRLTADGASCRSAIVAEWYEE